MIRSALSPSICNVSRSGPKILMPTAVRMPVASISIRPLMGIVQALVTPGNRTASSISAMSRLYVIPGRHSFFGLRVMVVSNMSSGAGSVAVLARPAFPKTVSTSGNVARTLSW